MSASVTRADVGVSGSPPESVVSLSAEWMQSQKKEQIWQVIANRSILAVRIVLEIRSASDTNCCHSGFINHSQLCGQESNLEKANAHTLDMKDGWLSHVVSRYIENVSRTAYVARHRKQP